MSCTSPSNPILLSSVCTCLVAGNYRLDWHSAEGADLKQGVLCGLRFSLDSGDVVLLVYALRWHAPEVFQFLARIKSAPLPKAFFGRGGAKQR